LIFTFIDCDRISALALATPGVDLDAQYLLAVSGKIKPPARAAACAGFEEFYWFKPIRIKNSQPLLDQDIAAADLTVRVQLSKHKNTAIATGMLEINFLTFHQKYKWIEY